MPSERAAPDEVTRLSARSRPVAASVRTTFPAKSYMPYRSSPRAGFRPARSCPVPALVVSVIRATCRPMERACPRDHDPPFPIPRRLATGPPPVAERLSISHRYPDHREVGRPVGILGSVPVLQEIGPGLRLIPGGGQKLGELPIRYLERVHPEVRQADGTRGNHQSLAKKILDPGKPTLSGQIELELLFRSAVDEQACRDLGHLDRGRRRGLRIRLRCSAPRFAARPP